MGQKFHVKRSLLKSEMFLFVKKSARKKFKIKMKKKKKINLNARQNPRAYRSSMTRRKVTFTMKSEGSEYLRATFVLLFGTFSLCTQSIDLVVILVYSQCVSPKCHSRAPMK